jgi:hypothetical protein
MGRRSQVSCRGEACLALAGLRYPNRARKASPLQLQRVASCLPFSSILRVSCACSGEGLRGTMSNVGLRCYAFQTVIRNPQSLEGVVT